MAVHHIVVGALVEGDRLLLCHRSPARRWYPNVWDLPGGHVEDGETELDPLRRELDEELGVRALVIDPEPIARIRGGSIDAAEGVFSLSVWMVRSWSGQPVNRAPDEHDQLAWSTSSDLDRRVLAYRDYAVLFSRILGHS